MIFFTRNHMDIWPSSSNWPRSRSGCGPSASRWKRTGDTHFSRLAISSIPSGLNYCPRTLASIQQPTLLYQQAGGCARNGGLTFNCTFSKGGKTYLLPKPTCSPHKHALSTPKSPAAKRQRLHSPRYIFIYCTRRGNVAFLIAAALITSSGK